MNPLTFQSTLQKQKSYVNQLQKLIQAHPDLRIVPMVDTEILAGEEHMSWMGGWGSAEIEHIYVADERVYFKSQDEEELGETIFFHLEENNPAWSRDYILEQTEEQEKDIPWEKVIIVNITLP